MEGRRTFSVGPQDNPTRPDSMSSRYHSMPLKASWPSQSFGSDDSETSVEVLALKENLRLQGRVRELENKLQQSEMELLHAREASRRSASESQREVQRLEEEVRELKFKLTDRVFRSPPMSMPKQEEQPQLSERRTNDPSTMSLDYSSQIHELLRALEKAHEDVLDCKKELKTEQDRSDELLYQLEHVKATCAQDVMTAREAAEAAKVSLASKSEELRILRAKLALSDQSSDEAARSLQGQLSAAEGRAAKAEEKVRGYRWVHAT
eukprot:591747-Hanusia_phi.AAC.1